jgi:hypothetical protein
MQPGANPWPGTGKGNRRSWPATMARPSAGGIQESTDPGREWTNPTPTTYTMTFKGNTLVNVTPRDGGKGLPLHARKALLEDTAAPMKTVTRFVADTTP